MVMLPPRFHLDTTQHILAEDGLIFCGGERHHRGGSDVDEIISGAWKAFVKSPLCPCIRLWFFGMAIGQRHGHLSRCHRSEDVASYDDLAPPGRRSVVGLAHAFHDYHEVVVDQTGGMPMVLLASRLPWSRTAGAGAERTPGSCGCWPGVAARTEAS